jgi:DNA/RNA endonuclease YhcR with UshA esterase domain
MKALFTAIIVFAAVFPGRAQTLFSDSLAYPNGPIVGNGLWYAYNTDTTSARDAFVTNGLLILNQNNAEAVAAPFTNTTSSTTYASFTINVSELPTAKGGYFFIFADTNDVAGGHVFIDRLDTLVPGTYRLGVANFATSITTALTTNFPVDLAPGVAYEVVVSYDSVLGASLQVNPSSANDLTVYPTDHSGTAPGPLSQISFSQYANQGVAAIGDVKVGIGFTDVDGVATNPPLPVIGIQPHSATNYSGNSMTLYTAASGLDLTYQWYGNDAALVDDGVTIVGSTSNILSLANLQATANYYVVATDINGKKAASTTATSTVITTPTKPFFTTQPSGLTNTVGSTVSLTGAANGTGPISYQWFFAPSNSVAFTALSGQTSGTLSVPNADATDSGSYLLQASNPAGSSMSAIVLVLITPPPLVSIASLHSLLVTNPPIPNSAFLGNDELYTVQGVVTTFGQIESKTTAEFFIQDDTGGALVYFAGVNPTNIPPAGSLVSVVGVVQEYYGQLELDPNVSGANNVTVIRSGATNGLALPAPAPLNIGLIATNTMGSYGVALQGSLVTMTNVYIYGSKTGAAVSGTFPTNSTKALYAFASPYSAGQPYVTIYVFTYTNVVNQLNTNYWGQPIPSFAYSVTGALDIYSTNTPEVYPSRYSDFVTTPTAPYFTTQPYGLTNGTGSTIELSGAAEGTGPISYQWFFAPSNSATFTALSGQTGGALTLTNAQVSYSGSYYLQATNVAGSTNSDIVSVLITSNAVPTAPFFTTQPYGLTNVAGSAIELIGAAGGTGPISYQWFFAPSNSVAFGALSGQTNGTLSLANAGVSYSGSYYLQASNVAGSTNSVTVSVLITPLPLVSIGYLHSLLVTNPPIPTSVSLGNDELYNVQGVVTTFGQIESKTTAEFFIQDATGGALVYFSGVNPTNVPPAGSLVAVSGEAQEYYGQLELDPSSSAAGGGVTIISSGATNGLALPAPAPLNIGLIATNTMGSYGAALQGSLVTMTNVYLYSSKTGAAVSGNFPTNSTKALYAFAAPYAAGQPYVTIYVYT